MTLEEQAKELKVKWASYETNVEETGWTEDGWFYIKLKEREER